MMTLLLLVTQTDVRTYTYHMIDALLKSVCSADLDLFAQFDGQTIILKSVIL